MTNLLMQTGWKMLLAAALVAPTLAVFTPHRLALAAEAAPAAEGGDADFPLQGEYSGKLTTPEGPQVYGVQVIALGEGKFRAVGYRGGLPGQGWDGGDKVESEAQREGGTVKFMDDRVIGLLSENGFEVSDLGGQKLGVLAKTVRVSPTMGEQSPEGAVVLFDGTSVDKFPGAQMTADGLLIQGATSSETFQSGRLHLEFQLPYMPNDSSQGRGNSGCYLQGRYEVQILDSFGLKGENNECGGIYSVSAPKVNMCLPPLSWQTYDIDFTAAKFDNEGKKTASARMTVRHNGVTIQDDVELPNATTAAPNGEGAAPGPVYLQDHGNPVRFRNIWLLKK